MHLSLVVARRSVGSFLVVASVLINMWWIPPAWAVADESDNPFGPGTVTGAVKSDRVGTDFFGLHINADRSDPGAWPDVEPARVRFDTFWKDIERSSGVYNWTLTDSRVASAEQHGAKPLLVLLATPPFHALHPDTPLFASAPSVSAYGRFARALVTRYGTRVDYQVWNEPNVPIFYTGTPRRMARMTQRFATVAHEVAPGATVVAPSFPLRVTSNRQWFRRYWSQRVGGKRVGAFVDASSISAYPMPEGDPEDGLAIAQWARAAIARAGFRGPLWATEINYGASGGYPTKEIPERREISNVIRTFVLHASLGADRVYWWMWTPSVTVNTELQDGQGVLTPAGVASSVVRDWLVGTRPSGCATVRGVTTCKFRVTRRLERSISWNRWGRKRTIIAPRGASSLTSFRGKVTSVVPGDNLQVGIVPMMLEIRRGRTTGRP